MRKRTILPVIALGALTLGTISTTLPAGASTQHSVRFGEDDNDGTTSPTAVSGTGSGSGAGSTPSGGASTGAGGMAGGSSSNPNVVLWLATGGAGLALIGTVARRRRNLGPALVSTTSSVSAPTP